MAKRIAPCGGYTYKSKRMYRDVVWKTLRQFSYPGVAVLMPSIEGDEIRTASAQGFPRDRMIAVDYSSAIAATCTRRFGIWRGMGCDIGKAFERLGREKVSVSAASIDFTGCMSPSLFGTLARIGDSGSLATESPATIAVNVLRGRESSAAREILEFFSNAFSFSGYEMVGVTDLDIGRVLCILAALQRPAVVRRVGSYVSSNGQSFLFIVATVFPSYDMRQEHFRTLRGDMMEMNRAVIRALGVAGKAFLSENVGTAA